MKVAIIAMWLFYMTEISSGALMSCSRKDPKLNECIADQIRKFWIPNLEKAFPQYGVPIVDPHSLGNIKITQGNKQVGLNYTASDVKFHGLKGVEVQKVDINQKTREFSLWYFNKKFIQLGQYVATGKILLFPINGHGKSNITIMNSSARINFKYDFVTEPKTKEKHIRVKNFEYKVKPGKAMMNFENLFNGDKYLSKQINDVINDNSNELLPSFAPSVEQALARAWQKLAEDFFAKVPLDQMFEA